MSRRAIRSRTPRFDPGVVKSQVTDAALVQRRREQIVAAAIELFSANGYFRTSIQQIARKAGVSIGLIYQYAETKDDILLLALMSVMERYRRELAAAEPSGDPLTQLHASLATYCRVVDTNRRAAILAYRSTMSLPQRFREFIKQAEVETNALMAARVRACIQAGLFRDIDVELTSYQLVMYAHTWALKHWRLSRLFDVDSYIDKGFDFFVHAMATPKGLAQYKRFLSSNGTSRN